MSRAKRRRRFGLRRGARFAQSLDDLRSDADQQGAWLAELGVEPDGAGSAASEENADAGHASASQREGEAPASVGLDEADGGSATLSGILVALAGVLEDLDRSLSNLETALPAARSAAADARWLADQVQVAIGAEVGASLADARRGETAAQIAELAERVGRLEALASPPERGGEAPAGVDRAEGAPPVPSSDARGDGGPPLYGDRAGDPAGAEN